ncbi:flavoprotein [Melampsora americana]|nr:flavoprotein [Melampsora americana]
MSIPSAPLHLLIATTGSVASIKLPLIVKALSSYSGIDIQVVATPHSLHFYDEANVVTEAGGLVKVWKDADEWSNWDKVSDPILHIELRRWADVILVCPCSANTLAKLAGGLCDNLLTSLLRATNPVEIPVILFPAMNTHMYEHPLTQKQIEVVRNEIGYEVSGPVSKTLACGDTGIGAMTEWSDIVKLVADRFHLEPKDGAAQRSMDH